ncbi:kunitz-type protease inhibitor 2 [Nematolebias whitei]|uniref:kunitz-type protease inhibitor 2 n=1 Tax=Nematolebias whitei TaxID=451745 RepID=UPI00189B77E2|nr:kunitz-type protease inhibitor 2 [Nematolebias whitei]
MDRKQQGAQSLFPRRGLPGPCPGARPGEGLIGERQMTESLPMGPGQAEPKQATWNEDNCKTTCTGVTVLPSSKKVPSENTEPCGLSPVQGHCRAAFPKFYYDPSSASCQSFLYGGCGGNANKFDSVEECMNRCSGHASVDTQGKGRSHWTAAFFLFVTLAVMSVLLLATLVIFTLRRHRLSRRSSASDKQELLPESDDLSSLDSMTIHEPPKPEPTA